MASSSFSLSVVLPLNIRSTPPAPAGSNGISGVLAAYKVSPLENRGSLLLVMVVFLLLLVSVKSA